MIQNLNTNLVVVNEPPPDGQNGMWLRISGELAGEGALVLRRAVEPLLMSPTPPKLKLIMEDVQYMDSSGIGVIVAIIQRMREVGGKLEIHGLSDVGRQLFQILRLANLKEVVTIAEN